MSTADLNYARFQITISELRKQRDALLAACKAALDCLDIDGVESAAASLRTTVRAAIAAIEGRAGG
jgi:translation elongation factor EF-Ts